MIKSDRVGDTTRVINRHHEYVPGAVDIGRPGRWGNPYFIGPDGNRAQVIQKYEVYIRGNPVLMADLPTLRNRRLACYCAPLPCHGDVLIKLIRELEDFYGMEREPSTS